MGIVTGAESCYKLAVFVRDCTQHATPVTGFEFNYKYMCEW